MRRRLLLAVAALAMAAGASPAAGPRIVSMNICTDQMLLALADPAQIMGLSRFSRDRAAGPGRRCAKISDPVRRRRGHSGAQARRRHRRASSTSDRRASCSRRTASISSSCRCRARSARSATRSARWERSPAIPNAPRAEIARLDAAIADASGAAGNRHFRVLPLSRRGWVPGRDSLCRRDPGRGRAVPTPPANSASISAASPRWKRSCS